MLYLLSRLQCLCCLDTMPNTEKPALKVLYDGSCPLCQIEINHLQNLANKDINSPLRFIDVSQDQIENVCYFNDRMELLQRFHVEFDDGSRLSGARAFAQMWLYLPGWRYLGLLAKLPGMIFILEVLYRFFLLIRPGLQTIIRVFKVNKSR